MWASLSTQSRATCRLDRWQSDQCDHGHDDEHHLRRDRESACPQRSGEDAECLAHGDNCDKAEHSGRDRGAGLRRHELQNREARCTWSLETRTSGISTDGRPFRTREKTPRTARVPRAARRPARVAARARAP